MKKFKLFTIVVCLVLIFSMVLCCKKPDNSTQTDTPNVPDKPDIEETVFSEADFKIDEHTAILYKQKNEPYDILNLSDPQVGSYNEGEKMDTAILHKTITQLVLEQQPDLITITGDLVWAHYGREEFADLSAFIDAFDIPWAPVMGNHDGESSDLPREDILKIYESAKNCLFFKGIESVEGCGNYIINIVEKDDSQEKKAKLVNTIFMIDSGENEIAYPDGGKGYGYVTDSQKQWYVDSLDKAKKINGGKTAESMVFMHIPPPEVVDAYDYWEDSGYDEEIGFGEKNEYMAVSDYNNGFFDLIKEQDSTKHIFYGHDHINNFGVLYEGIWMVYVLKTGEGCYYKDYMNGGTLITLNDSISFEHKYVNPYKDDRDMMYFVNCGLLDEIPQVGKNMYSYDKSGKLQTYLDQLFGKDSKTDYSWGRVESENWYYGTEYGQKHGDKASKFYSLIWSQEDTAIQYAFELPVGNYEITLGFYERWWTSRAAIITIGNNTYDTFYIDKERHDKKTIPYSVESSNDKELINISVERGYDNDRIQLSYIEIVFMGTDVLA